MISWDETPDAQIAAMTDVELLRTYHRTTGQAGDPDAKALLAEMVRRELDL